MDLGMFVCPQSGKAAEKTPTKPCDVEVYEKKIKLLEKQRKDVSLFSFFFFFFALTAHPLLPLGKVSVYLVSYMFSVICFTFWRRLTGTRGEQAVGHSVELHEVTV